MNELKTIVTSKVHSLRVISLIGVLIYMAIPTVAIAASQGFYVQNNQNQQGLVVSLSTNPGVVEPASQRNAKQLVGVIAPLDETSFDLQPKQVSVRTDGTANALISTLGGDIHVGDKIGVSSLLGVGTKQNGSGWIIGTAQGSLDRNTKGAVQMNLNTGNGGKHTVYVASVPMIVKVIYFTQPSAPNDSSHILPTYLQTLVDTVAGKHASTLAVILSFVLLVFGFCVAGVLINSAVRGGMLAISRQPLAKFVIQGKILQAFGLALLILLAMVGAALLLLRVL